MVRVISIPLFKKQNIQTIERSVTTCCVALPNKLLVASNSSHCIEVTDLDIEQNTELYQSDEDTDDINNLNICSNNISFSFPTVDSVKQIIHCQNGNYIATLETKSNSRHNRCSNYVRIYANWDNVATLQQSKMTQSGVSLGQSECGMVQPMRARIAGRVTPSVIQSSEVSSLEMIEIPVKRSPELITCCQISGNLLISAGRILTVYKFIIKSHDVSKQRFIDFEEVSISFELSFVPNEIYLLENYISATSSAHHILFKVDYISSSHKSHSKVHHQNGKNLRDSQSHVYDFTKTDNYCIDYQKVMKNETNYTNSQNTVILPTILKENNQNYKNLPFKNCPNEVYVNIKSVSPIEATAQSFQIKSLLQLKISPDINIDGTMHPISEEFKISITKPLYINQRYFNLYKNDTVCIIQSHSKRDKGRSSEKNKNFLKSNYYKSLKTVICLICTLQEGYLYNFDVEEEIGSFSEYEVANTRNLVSIYSFTSPVLSVVLQNSLVHALTDCGLESYTLKSPFWGWSSPISPIYLIGLKSFLGIKKIFIAESNLILLANYEGSPVHSTGSSNSSSNSSNWTLYNLELPSTITLYKDILKIAKLHKKDSIQTFVNLLNESHQVLRINLLLQRFKIIVENGVNIIEPIKEQSIEQDTTTSEKDIFLFNENILTSADSSPSDNSALDIADNYVIIENAFKNSCGLLGDFYLTSKKIEDYKQALPNYKMGGFTPLEVMKRFKNIATEISTLQDLQGFLHYLKTMILEISFGPEADEIFSPINDSNSVLTFLQKFEQLHQSAVENCSYVDTSGSKEVIENDIHNGAQKNCNIQPSNYSIFDEKILEQNFGQTFADIILELFNKYDPEVIPYFVIKSNVMKEYATDKIINILVQRKERNSLDNFALTLLYLQKSDSDNANATIHTIDDQILQDVLKENWGLLFEKTSVTNIPSKKNVTKNDLSFSDLFTVLIVKKTEFLSNFLFMLIVDYNKISLRELLKIFVDFLPSHIGPASPATTTVLQMLLEKYLMYYFSKTENKNLDTSTFDSAIQESITLLARTYLSKLLFHTKMMKKNIHKNKERHKLAKKLRESNKEMSSTQTICELNQDNSSQSKKEKSESQLKSLHFEKSYKDDDVAENKSTLVTENVLTEKNKLKISDELKHINEYKLSNQKVKHEPMLKTQANFNENFKNMFMAHSDVLSRNDMIEDDYLFSDSRYRYLDLIPPFGIFKNDAYVQKNKDDILLIMKQLQALICSNILPKIIIQQIVLFVSKPNNLIGELTLQSLVFPIDKTTLLLLSNCPGSLIQFSKDRFTKNDDWKNVIIILENKINSSMTENKNNVNLEVKIFEKILKEILTHLATTVPLETLLKILPTKIEKKDLTVISVIKEETDTNVENEIDNPNIESKQILTVPNEVVSIVAEVFEDQPLNLTNSVSEPLSLTDKSDEAIKTVKEYNDLSDVILRNDYLVEDFEQDEQKHNDSTHLETENTKINNSDSVEPDFNSDTASNKSTENYDQEKCTLTQIKEKIDSVEESSSKINVNTESEEILCNYDAYIQLCKQTAHANQLKQFIVSTGQQLLATLNL